MAAYTPGMEISGGSLGIGLGIAVGMCLGLKRKKSDRFVYNLMSDGELGEGPTWEAAMSAGHWKLDNLICIVDVNRMQADGPPAGVLNSEPLPAKWEAFGWHAQRVNGNDIGALVRAFDAARALQEPKPRVIVCDTKMAKGVPFLETREKSQAPTAAEQAAEGGQLPGQPPKKRLTTSAMIASLAGEGQRTKPAPFGHALVEVAKSRPEVVGMTADLGKYTDLHIFGREFPDRYYQMGMAEQLLMLAAAGMAHEGFVPFVTTYAVFASRRTYDFISQGIAEEGLNVKICCALPGLTTGYGPSHQATEDVAIFRGMPDLTIVDPCDALDIEQATPAIAAHDGPVYMRLLRGNVPLVLDEYDYRFELGKAKLVRDGTDALVVSSGFMTMRALEAAKLLEADRVSVAVLHSPTIKPLDEETIVREARRAGRLVVVAENHSAIGGLGEAVAGTLLRAGAAPAAFRQVALPDAFLDAGALPTLHDRYGISAEAMARSIKRWM
jgi:transketolase